MTIPGPIPSGEVRTRPSVGLVPPALGPMGRDAPGPEARTTRPDSPADEAGGGRKGWQA
jgi:hypothetical protein